MPTHVPSTAAFLALLLIAGPAFAQPGLPPAFQKPIPASVQDLQEIETHVQKLVDKVLPATVNLRIGPVQGSGVIINREGYILTAGHVSGKAGQEVTVILADGRHLKGRTLGANKSIDSGLVRITEAADLPFVAMARSAPATKGQWCLALGHPNGLKPGRPPVVRLGRVQRFDQDAIVTDCTLVGGDSGGPLFYMHGKVIGIHSRIGGTLSSNVHFPIDAYHDAWSRLAASEVWGNLFTSLPFAKSNEAYLGVRASVEKMSLKIDSVTPGSPADNAGLKSGDVIRKINGVKLVSVDELAAFLKTQRPATRIEVHVQRGDESVAIAVVLGKRAS